MIALSVTVSAICCLNSTTRLSLYLDDTKSGRVGCNAPTTLSKSEAVTNL